MNSKGRIIILTVLVGMPALVCWGQEPQGQTAPQPPAETQTASPMGVAPNYNNDKIVKRIPKLEMYPCTDCHSNPEDFNTQARTLTKDHLDKAVHFKKGDAVPSASPEQVAKDVAAATGGKPVAEEHEPWCHRCHTEGNYLKLHLQSGKEISFNEAYQLCGECHGTQYNDWKKNMHGKRTGQWNGPREAFSCPECHDPHKPAFKPLAPKPPPNLPRGKSKSYIRLLLGDLIHEKKPTDKEDKKPR